MEDPRFLERLIKKDRIDAEEATGAYKGPGG
jgi:hypothetical protein